MSDSDTQKCESEFSPMTSRVMESYCSPDQSERFFMDDLDQSMQSVSFSSPSGGRRKKQAKGSKGRKGKKGKKRSESPQRPSPRDMSSSPDLANTLKNFSPSAAVEVPQEDEVMVAKREIRDISRNLTRSLAILNRKREDLERRIEQTQERAVLPFQHRRAQQQSRELRKEIQRTEHVMEEIKLMTSQLQEVSKLRESVMEATKKEIVEEVERLTLEKASHKDAIRAGFVDRICLLNVYWPWRQLLELGDMKVGTIFQDELARGPRYRNVGIQNNIQSETSERQLRWLEEIVNREDVFRGHLNKLDALVEDLMDITDFLETALTCQVCSLLFEDPVVLWPCGHTFCYVCFRSLIISPSLYRCPTCSCIGSEGFVHNLLIGDAAAKWMFKDSGYGDLKGPMTSIRLHLSRFSRQNIQNRIVQLRDAIKNRALFNLRSSNDELITISYRAY